MPNFLSIFRLVFSWFWATTRPRQLTVLFAAALAIGTAFVFALRSQIHLNVNTDYFTDYKPTAEDILNGRGIVGADGQLETRYPPGYPLCLVAAYEVGELLRVNRDKVIVGFNLITGAASSLFVYTTIELLFGASIALLTWLLWATYIPGLVTFLHPNSEVPFMLFFFAAVWVFCLGVCREHTSAESGFFAGTLLGAAALVRPIAVFLPFVFIVAAVTLTFVAGKPEQKSKKGRYKLAATILLGFVLSIAPWELFVRAKTARFILLATNGPASVSDGLVFALAPGPSGDRVSIPAHLQELMERANLERSGMRTDSDILQFVWKQGARNPLGVAELFSLKLRRAWYGMYSKRYEWVILALQLPCLLLAATGMMMSFAVHNEKKDQLIFLCSLVAYFWIMTCTVVPMLRYMVPAMPWVMFLVALAAHTMCTSGSWASLFSSLGHGNRPTRTKTE